MASRCGMKEKNAMILLISFFLIISGCLHSGEKDEEELVIAMINFELDVEIKIEAPIQNDSILLVPTIVNSQNNPLQIRSFEVDNVEEVPNVILSENGYVLNITRFLDRGRDIFIRIYYDYHNVEEKFSKEDVIVNNNTQFFMDTPGLSTWWNQTVLVYSYNIEVRVGLSFTRGGEIFARDHTGRYMELHNGWNSLKIERGWDDNIG